jgi:quinol monooxygenase YgiN
MVEHLVLFKLKEGATAEEQQLVVDALKKLRSIEGIIDLSVGINHSKEGKSKDYEVGLRVTFKDQASLEAYGPSEAHQNVVAEILPYFVDVIVVDYTI